MAGAGIFEKTQIDQLIEIHILTGFAGEIPAELFGIIVQSDAFAYVLELLADVRRNASFSGLPPFR